MKVRGNGGKSRVSKKETGRGRKRKIRERVMEENEGGIAEKEGREGERG